MESVNNGMKTDKKVIIIGGGLAGLAAAERLLASGERDFLMLEAKERLGGRVYSVRNGGKVLEMGAQWIHGEVGNPLFQIAKEHNLLRKGKDIIQNYWLGTSQNLKNNQNEKKSDDCTNEDGSCYAEGNNFVLSDGTRINDGLVDGIIEEFTRQSEIADYVFLNEKWDRELFKTSLHEIIENREQLPIATLKQNIMRNLDDMENISMYKYIEKNFNKFFEEQTKSSDKHQNVEQLDRNMVLQKALLDWRIKIENVEISCGSLDEIPVSVWGEYALYGGDNEIELGEGGFQAVVDVLVDRIRSGCGCKNVKKSAAEYQSCEHVRLECVVERIEWKGGRCDCGLCSSDGGVPLSEVGKQPRSKGVVSISLRGGGTLKADHVIVTLPLGVLKEKVCGLRDEATISAELFVPALPACKLNSIRNLSFGTVNKIFLEFEKPPWSLDTLKCFQFVWLKDETIELESLKRRGRSFTDTPWVKEIQGFDCHLPNKNILCGWVGGPASVAMETEDDQMVEEVCLELLQRFVGMSEEQIPKLVSMLRSRWHSDEHSKGVYSYRGFNSSFRDSVILSYPVPSRSSPEILFAGEACHPIFYSTAHGALLSGWDQAQLIIDHFVKR